MLYDLNLLLLYNKLLTYMTKVKYPYQIQICNLICNFSRELNKNIRQICMLCFIQIQIKIFNKNKTQQILHYIFITYILI